ncbi:hypothetical protein PHYBLDRAFT_147558 [Phycomyces blakesleeanus NRRL 1555(-)]|uniref:Uncharacterized protein n=1 Tax=Phycomyces blakesleeanus (strain ATCC 8743b / DSM 1359 / FGSC 10004 / NBRC 33097 / NRRL 1555) TaxID=763407 RepID=A0A162X0E6_PHYB8|nr:hypothetical protein PHYBLDRAFT_147558 [Phycomyces blakesleeanus NRRL 1555(-)]OAD71795.1 hypothetical protein PHYBLDRAFT_147558 [Phycomyces blakesleeanus NRRL 1555(-)]|eukprot:XP_018289835.1 hypothetical protein PHYBLDRAFT_147558 [Phycomyces blakesleeanus NRRL 1555(-)]
MASASDRTRSKNMLHSTNTKHKPKKRARKRAIDEITIQESQDMVTTWQRAVEDVNEYPDADYDRMVDQLNKIKAERLVRAKLLRDTQRKLVVNWFAAQTEQAKNDFQSGHGESIGRSQIGIAKPWGSQIGEERKTKYRREKRDEEPAVAI